MDSLNVFVNFGFVTDDDDLMVHYSRSTGKVSYTMVEGKMVIAGAAFDQPSRGTRGFQLLELRLLKLMKPWNLYF